MNLIRARVLGVHATDEDIGTAQSDHVFRETVGLAYFWPLVDGATQAGVRTLQGELDLKASLKPNFVFPKFTLRVRTFAHRQSIPKLTYPYRHMVNSMTLRCNRYMRLALRPRHRIVSLS